MNYKVGTRVRITATFRDYNDALVSPTVAASYEKPDGTLVTGVSLTNPSTGVYVFNIDTDMSGVWKYRATASGAAIAMNESEFYVEELEF